MLKELPRGTGRQQHSAASASSPPWHAGLWCRTCDKGKVDTCAGPASSRKPWLGFSPP